MAGEDAVDEPASAGDRSRDAGERASGAFRLASGKAAAYMSLNAVGI